MRTIIAAFLAVLVSVTVATVTATPAAADPVIYANDPADTLYPVLITPDRAELGFALLDAGYTGHGDDGTDAVIYAPMWMVVDVPGGTWTTTPEGPKRCVDFRTVEGVECSDGVYLPWLPEYIGH